MERVVTKSEGLGKPKFLQLGGIDTSVKMMVGWATEEVGYKVETGMCSRVVLKKRIRVQSCSVTCLTMSICRGDGLRGREYDFMLACLNMLTLLAIDDGTRLVR
mgnify:FL=1